MPIYIRCVLANQYTCVGYILLLLGIVIMVLRLSFGWPPISSVVLTGAGLGMLLYSRFGLITMRVYRALTNEYKKLGAITHSVGRLSYHHLVAVTLVLADIDKELEAKARQEPP